MLPMSQGSFGVYSLVAWTKAPVPSALLYMKFCWAVSPCQSVVLNDTNAPLKLPQPMLALSATPPDIWPLQPRVRAGGLHSEPMGLFSMLVGKLKPATVEPPGPPPGPPLSRAVHRLQTFWFEKLPN